MDVVLGTIDLADLRVLRPLLLASPGGDYDADYPGDLAADTLHVAARRAGDVIGFATVLREPCPLGEGARDWRIRGLAVVPEARGQGIAGELLGRCTSHADSCGAERVWAWARPTSQRRFLKAGFEVAEGQGRLFGSIGWHELLIRPAASPVDG